MFVFSGNEDGVGRLRLVGRRVFDTDVMGWVRCDW